MMCVINFFILTLQIQYTQTTIARINPESPPIALFTTIYKIAHWPLYFPPWQKQPWLSESSLVRGCNTHNPWSAWFCDIIYLLDPILATSQSNNWDISCTGTIIHTQISTVIIQGTQFWSASQFWNWAWSDFAIHPILALGCLVLELDSQSWNCVSYMKPQFGTRPILAPVPKWDVLM